ncbi:hypothetical protein VP01_6056g1 [Puccinia sorghi]|uniref:Uncharacterized protein n=1 Tax=Puccinia sorghi TaxID=27349 RepID=A0A0L6UI31_9BASI|nr:hypothetical protein VP01_6056g1 [Puccinia sorghi]
MLIFLCLQGTPMKVIVGFPLFIAGKKKNDKKMWKIVNSQEFFNIKILFGLTSFDKFQDKAAQNCNRGFSCTYPTTGSPHISWMASIPKGPKYLKKNKIDLKNPSNYKTWLQCAKCENKYEISLGLKISTCRASSSQTSHQELVGEAEMHQDSYEKYL